MCAVIGSTISHYRILAKLGSGQYNLRVQVDPAAFGVTAIDPAVVSITIR